jgi:dihydrofolate reductase
MRKISTFVLTTLDGYHEGPGHEIDWHNVDEEFNRLAIEQLDATAALVFGRVTYEMMAAYWPTAAAIEDDPEVASRMNRLPKVVVSRTLTPEAVTWAGTRLVDTPEGLSGLDGEVIVMGSANLTASLLRAGLLDELRIMVNPVLLGAGVPVLQGAPRTGLCLRSTRLFASGNVLLTYTTIRT